MNNISRREAIARVSLIMGGTLSAPALAFLSGCSPEVKEEKQTGLFDETQQKTIAVISSLIIPATDTPGAKEANVPEFVQYMIEDCYPKEDQNRFISGLGKIDKESKASYNEPFLNLNEQKQIELLTRLEIEAREERQKDANLTPPALLMLKELTLLGYFTSEIGATKALVYDPVPGKYEACVPLKEGQRSWAT